MPAGAQSHFNEIFATLITPSRRSFVSQEERALLAIPGGAQNRAALERHAAKYFWIENSYAGPKYLSASDFRKKLLSLQRVKTKSAATQLKFSYRFSPELRTLRQIIDYCATWQDERKALVFKNISLAGLVLREVARRLGQPADSLYYLGLAEIKGLRSLADLPALMPVLQERRKGCLIVIQGPSDKIISGPDYRRLLAGRQRLLKDEVITEQDLHGTVANTGTARGRVRLIKNLASLQKFRSGEILVASMTRPEYMSAIKKAAAIVTDEGGITCHAAIIARELNIPCVIGTKVATQVLKDGLIAEVRANHGLVRVIK
jgi:phosphohistidine swiveling domain-containing protein